MKAPYVGGSSDPPRPRVMAADPQGHAVSVDSPSIAVRALRMFWDKPGDGNRVSCRFMLTTPTPGGYITTTTTPGPRPR